MMGRFIKPADWVPRLKISPTTGRVVDEDAAVEQGVAIVLTEADYHSKADPGIRAKVAAGQLHEHCLPAQIWWTDSDRKRSVAGLLAAIEGSANRWRWLASTKELQEGTYGYDFEAMSTAEEAFFLQWNLLAAYQEIGEIGVEFSWKPWAVDEPFVNEERVLDEVVDVLHFLGNILVAMGVDDDLLELRYRLKQDKNRRRKASGTYSARKGGLGEGSEVE